MNKLIKRNTTDENVKHIKIKDDLYDFTFVEKLSKEERNKMIAEVFKYLARDDFIIRRIIENESIDYSLFNNIIIKPYNAEIRLNKDTYCNDFNHLITLLKCEILKLKFGNDDIYSDLTEDRIKEIITDSIIEKLTNLLKENFIPSPRTALDKILSSKKMELYCFQFATHKIIDNTYFKIKCENNVMKRYPLLSVCQPGYYINFDGFVAIFSSKMTEIYDILVNNYNYNQYKKDYYSDNDLMSRKSKKHKKNKKEGKNKNQNKNDNKNKNKNKNENENETRIFQEKIKEEEKKKEKTEGKPKFNIKLKENLENIQNFIDRENKSEDLNSDKNDNLKYNYNRKRSKSNNL